MKKTTLKTALAGTLTLAALASPAATGLTASPKAGGFEPAKSGVEKPRIKPVWSGAKQGVWTMDWEAALAKASAEGRYTLVYFSGMWWCPRCKEFEKYVISTSAWKRFVKDRGLYLAVIDSPKRNGRDGWCWLWDKSYRKSARLSAEDAAAEIAARYALQDELHDPAATVLRTATNYVVEVTGRGRSLATNYTVCAESPVSEYHSINYPGVVIFDPEGNEVGRFVPDTAENPGYTLETALQYCMDRVDEAINPSALDPWVGKWTLAYSRPDGAGLGALALTVDPKGKVKVSGYTHGGVKVSSTSRFVTGGATSFIPVRFRTKDAEPAFTLRIDNATQGVSLESADGGYSLVGGGLANAPLPPYVRCKIAGFPTQIGGFDVVPESVPESLTFTVKGKKMSDTAGNRISYTPSTGMFKGSFKVQVIKRGRLAKASVSVNGVYDGRFGYGTALAKGAAAAGVTLEPAEGPDDGCGDCGL